MMERRHNMSPYIYLSCSNKIPKDERNRFINAIQKATCNHVSYSKDNEPYDASKLTLSSLVIILLEPGTTYCGKGVISELRTAREREIPIVVIRQTVKSGEFGFSTDCLFNIINERDYVNYGTINIRRRTIGSFEELLNFIYSNWLNALDNERIKQSKQKPITNDMLKNLQEKFKPDIVIAKEDIPHVIHYPVTPEEAYKVSSNSKRKLLLLLKKSL